MCSVEIPSRAELHTDASPFFTGGYFDHLPLNFEKSLHVSTDTIQGKETPPQPKTCPVTEDLKSPLGERVVWKHSTLPISHHIENNVQLISR